MSRRFRPVLPAIAAIVGAHAAFAQQNDIPLNRDIYYDIDRNGACRTSTMHTGLRPIIESRADLDNVMGWRLDTTRHYYQAEVLLTKKHLIDVRDGGFHVTIDPAFQFEYGKELYDKDTSVTRAALEYFNGRGFWVKADFGRKLSVQSTFYENQAVMPTYLYLYSEKTGVIPGQGRKKEFNQTGLDFAWAMGNVSWTPKPWLNLQLGHGRHFVGNGYRSVLLSDNTSPYPYIKFSAITNNGRFQYTTIYSKLESLGTLLPGNSADQQFYWKHATFQHASVNLGPAQIGLFEATIWEDLESVNDTLHRKAFNAMELNPVIGVNTLTNGFGGPNKQLVGIDAKYRLTDKLFLYGQFALDDPGKSRYAWQAGLQWFDLFRRDLHVLLEYDEATPFAYANTLPRQNYAHFGQPLAHPLGAGFDEAVAIVDYGIKQKFWLRGTASIAHMRVDTAATENHGGDIFMSNVPGPDSVGYQARQRLWLDFSFTWRINQMYNMFLSLGWSQHMVDPAPKQLNSNYIYITWRTGLFNRYYDF